MAVAVISRGIPGSGKSTFNRMLKSVSEARGFNIAIHSTDDFHMVDGKYVFQMDKLAWFHKRNYTAFSKSISDGVDVVVVDNTNLKAKEYKDYVAVATNFGYPVVAVRFIPDEIEKHFARQAHGVPFDRLVAMKESLIASGASIGVTEEFVVQPSDFSEDYLRNLCKDIIKSVISE